MIFGQPRKQAIYDLVSDSREGARYQSEVEQLQEEEILILKVPHGSETTSPTSRSSKENHIKIIQRVVSAAWERKLERKIIHSSILLTKQKWHRITGRKQASWKINKFESQKNRARPELQKGKDAQGRKYSWRNNRADTESTNPPQ